MAFEIPGDEPTCLWKSLAAGVCRLPSDRRKRVAINDSKKLKGAKDAAGHPLRHLERGVLAFAGVGGVGDAGADGAGDASGAGASARFPTDDALLHALGAPVPADSLHAGALALPVGNEPAQLGIAASMVRNALTKAKASMLMMRVRAIAAQDFNAQADRIGNKATINFMAAMEHVDSVRRLGARAGLCTHVALDQQGGRRSYLRSLATSFPSARLRVLDESDEAARYQLDFPEGDGLPAHLLVVSFEQGGEARHLPIALASMAAKFARELHMRRLNAFFAQYVPELKPTAGYVQDGRRFLDDIRPALQRLGLPETHLVRAK